MLADFIESGSPLSRQSQTLRSENSRALRRGESAMPDNDCGRSHRRSGTENKTQTSNRGERRSEREFKVKMRNENS